MPRAGLEPKWNDTSYLSAIKADTVYNLLKIPDEDDNQLRPYSCMDVSCNGRVLCAGSELVQDDAYLVFWDQRHLKPLGGYWNSHTDDITQVCRF